MKLLEKIPQVKTYTVTMAAYFYLLLVLCAIVSMVSTDEVNIRAEMSKPLLLELSRQYKENEADRKKRSVTFFNSNDRDNIVKIINDLRRSVGAANMPYMSWNSQLESDMNTWTEKCNYDTIVSSTSPAWTIKGYSSWKSNFPVNLTSFFNNPTIGLGPSLKSVYLTQIAASETFCNLATADGSLYSRIYISVVAFTIGSSSFDQNAIQYTLGEACTRCTSGVFWCDYGLCRADCSSSVPTCFCYPDCANCATVNLASCQCQCLNGWGGTRCETQLYASATTPACSTTVRTPYRYKTTAKASAISLSRVIFIISILLLLAHIKRF